MTGKRADVKKASRDAAEAFFERMLPKDDDMRSAGGRIPERKGSDAERRGGRGEPKRRADKADGGG